ncbi:MAG TPA: FAD-dependent oxidoreductase [Phycisphaerae bacterium]|nr:FAD-dependent oxidoreductase [Phycisphaerales bacterium]HRX86021.1 FAD-dependent oxidoreductase [Phycisphaerae bacterium]
MPLIVRNIVLALDEPEEVLLERVAGRLNVPPAAILRHAIARRSLDARKGHGPQFVYSVEVALDGGGAAELRAMRRARNVERIDKPDRRTFKRGTEPLPQRPVVVGFGPAGMFAALLLAEAGYQPIVLERGRDVRNRHRDIMQRFYRDKFFDPESNLLYGEGGAGTYSDGKVYTRVGSPAVQNVLAILVRFGADPDILINAKPHIGSDRLPTICWRLRTHIEQLGGEVRFEQRVDDFEIRDGVLTALQVGERREPVGPVLLGIGHSARDTYQRLRAAGVTLAAKPFQLGVRIEHPQELVNRWQYGTAAGHPKVPPADYSLVAKGAGNGSDLFSFCMCPGGTILPTNEAPGLIATNGASRASRGGPFANSGLVITIDPATLGGDPFSGLELQRRCEATAFAATGGSYAVPAQRCNDFLAGRASDGVLATSYPLGGGWAAIADIVPERVTHALMRGLPMLAEKLPGFDGPESIITAPESRASASVRIPRDEKTRQSVNVRGLFPIGEGAGYAGGIVSAAIDGMHSAEAIMARYRPA